MQGSSISSPIHPAAGDKDISSSSGDIEGAHNPHSLHSQHSLHSPVGHSFHTTGCGATTMTGSNADYAFAYVSFVPGGDAGIYFMMALFVAIVIDKLVTTAIGAT